MTAPVGVKECSIEGCGKPRLSRGWCQHHYYINYTRHRRKGKVRLNMKKGFSTERYCSLCDTVKDWKQYYLELGMCAECHRERIREEREITPDGKRVGRVPKPKETPEERWQDMLDFLATKVQE